MRLLPLAALAALAALTPAIASPLLLSDLPANSAALVHLDFDRIENARIGTGVMSLLRESAGGGTPLKTIDEAGIDPRKDIRGATLVVLPGSSNEFALYLRGKYNAAKLAAFATSRNLGAKGDNRAFSLAGVTRAFGGNAPEAGRVLSPVNDNLIIVASSANALGIALAAVEKPITGKEVAESEKSIASRGSFASLMVAPEMIASHADKGAPAGIQCIGGTLDETAKSIRLRITASCAKEETAIALRNLFNKGIKFYATSFAAARADEPPAARAGRELISAALRDAKAESAGRLTFVNADIETEAALDCLARITPSKPR